MIVDAGEGGGSQSFLNALNPQFFAPWKGPKEQAHIHVYLKAYAKAEDVPVENHYRHLSIFEKEWAHPPDALFSPWIAVAEEGDIQRTVDKLGRRVAAEHRAYKLMKVIKGALYNNSEPREDDMRRVATKLWNKDSVLVSNPFGMPLSETGGAYDYERLRRERQTLSNAIWPDDTTFSSVTSRNLRPSFDGLKFHKIDWPTLIEKINKP